MDGSDAFFTRAHMAELCQGVGLQSPYFWGRVGPEAVSAIEAELGFKLVPQLRDFARHIGNMEVGGFRVIVSGADSSAGLQSCVSETLAAREGCPQMAASAVVIMQDELSVFAMLD